MQNLILFGILSACMCGTFAQVTNSQLCEGVPVDKYVRDVRDCKVWIRCKGTQAPVSGKCPDPYFFDVQNQFCSVIENVACYKCANNTGLQNEEVPNSCKRFIRCINGVATEGICESGTLFSPTEKQCVPEAKVVCDKVTCPVKLPAEGFYAYNDPANCSKGFVCIGDPSPIPVDCKDGLHFNKQTLACALATNSGCNPQSTSSTGTNPVATTPTTITSPSTNPNQPGIEG